MHGGVRFGVILIPIGNRSFTFSEGEDELHGLKLDWKRFVSEQLQDFCREEIRAVKHIRIFQLQQT